METIANIILIAGTIGFTLGSVWLLLIGIDKAKQRYRRKVWESALYIARNRQDLLADVVREFEMDVPTQPAPGRELALPKPRRARPQIIESLTRAELEQYTYRLEGVAAEFRDRWLAAADKANLYRGKWLRADRLRSRYLRKIRRIDAAHAAGEPVFPVLHPFLARAETP